MAALRLLLILPLGVLIGCSGTSSTPPEVADPPPSFHSGFPVEDWFPLIDGHLYQYETETDAGRGLLVNRVERAEAARGQLVSASGARIFLYEPAGLSLVRLGMSPAFILKMPATVGASWKGEHRGVVQLTGTHLRVQVPAGSYDDCLETVELRGGDRPMRLATTFCRGVGIVKLEASSGDKFERATLKNHGPPIDIGPDGVTQLK